MYIYIKLFTYRFDLAVDLLYDHGVGGAADAERGAGS
jgi:hypothetical protein